MTASRSDLPTVAVVTGASRGLGAGLAEALAAASIQLGLCARQRPSVPGGADAVADEVDVSDVEAITAFADRVVERFGRIDLWINNAGILEPIGALSEAEPALVRRHLEINVGGVLYGSAAFARHVRRRPGGGVLVNISSGAATTPYQGWAVYCAAKAAVAMASEVTALDEAAHGLRVYALAPGVVDTDMQAQVRTTSAEVMPAVERFRAIERQGAFNSPRWVAAFILGHCWGASRSTSSREDPVRVRVPDEHPG